MKKKLLLGLKILGGLLLFLLVVGFFGYRYINATFLNFEKEYTERKDFKTLTNSGHRFFG